MEANIADFDGTPAVGLTVVVFRDGQEYSQAVTGSDGTVALELGEPTGHDYAFEARAGDEVMAYAAFEGQDESDGDSVLPTIGLMAGTAIMGLMALVTARRRD